MGKVKPTKRKSRKGKKKETAQVPIEKTEAKRLMLREIREEGYDGEFFADNLETKMADRMKRGKLPRRIRYLEYCHWAHSLMRKEIGPSDAQFSFPSTVLSFIRALVPGDVVGEIREIFLGVSIGVGIIAGLLTLCIFYLGLFVLGATMGWFVGMLLLPLMYKHVEFLSEHNWVPYVVLLAFAIAGGILIICIQKVIIVISTSFVGAFAVITGFDYYLENSTALYYSVNMLHGHYDKSDLPHCWYTWLMFSLIPIMFIAGMVVQLKKTGQGRDHREAYSRRSRVPFMGTRMDEFSDQRPLVTAEE